MERQDVAGLSIAYERAGAGPALVLLHGAFGLDRPHVLGVSFGGGLALQLVDRHPATVRSLVVLSGAYAGWAGSLLADVLATRLQQAERETTMPSDQWLPSYVPGMVSRGASTDVIEQVHELMRGIRPGGHLMMLRAMAAADLRPTLPRVTVPTLVLHGEHDERSPLRIGKELHASIPGSKLVVLPGVGHVSNLEAPEGFNRAVREFLLGIDTRR